jgi:hypothetical protein
LYARQKWNSDLLNKFKETTSSLVC